MVIELLGPSLESLIEKSSVGPFGHPCFTLPTVYQLVDQMLMRLEVVHSRALLHRDIKPDNMLMGPDGSPAMYLVDFGLSKYFKSEEGFHIEWTSGKPMAGTERYASIGTHLGWEQSRRDDLEASSYVFVYLAKGRLPWQGSKPTKERTREEVLVDTKRSLKGSEIAKGLPPVFGEFIDYARSLEFEEKPKYGEWRERFKVNGKHIGVRYDGVYDWSRRGK